MMECIRSVCWKTTKRSTTWTIFMYISCRSSSIVWDVSYRRWHDGMHQKCLLEDNEAIYNMNYIPSLWL